MQKQKIKLDDISSEDSITLDSITLNDLGTYMLFEEIDSDSMRDACEFVIKANYVYRASDAVTLMINSPGGGVYDGFSLVDLIECSKVKIQTVAVGCVASMGAVIFTAGTPGHRVMSRNSCMMVHQFSDLMETKYHEIIAARSHQDKLHDKCVNHFVKHSKMSKEKVKSILLSSSDCYLEPKDALKFGLCDRIQNPWE